MDYRVFLALAAAASLTVSASARAAPSAKDQIAQAVQAAPADRQAGARVLGYDAQGRLTTLRKGQNDLVCLADDPQKKGFQAACYHVQLEPYMARGRALRTEGIDGSANREKRWAEIKAGKLAMPEQPRTLYVLHGKSVDPKSGQVVDPYLRWVIFTPFATPESTGLSLQPSPGAPWLMFPGTAGAHIMINPPKQ